MRYLNALPMVAIIFGCCVAAQPRETFVDSAVEEAMDSQAPNAVSTAKPIVREADRAAIMEAVYRYRFAQRISFNPSDSFFVALDGGIDPPSPLLQRLEKGNPLLLPASMAMTDAQHNVVHKTTGGKGNIFQIRGIAFINETNADVNSEEYSSPMGGAEETYHVICKNGKWIVVTWRLNSVSRFQMG